MAASGWPCVGRYIPWRNSDSGLQSARLVLTDPTSTPRKAGFMPGAGGTQRLPRLVGVGRAKELLYSGESIDAQEAFRIGLVNKVVAADSLRETALEMAGRLAARAPVALRLIKSAVNRGINMELQSALAYESRCFEMLFTTRDQKEGMQAFVEKRKPEFEGR